MIKRITNTDFIDYLNCPYKTHLKINGKSGKKTDYEIMEDELIEEYKNVTLNFFKHKWKYENVVSNVSIRNFNSNDFRKGLNIHIKVKEFDVIFDGLSREFNANEVIIPIMFLKKENISINDKLYLAFYGIVLKSALGVLPSFGRIIHGINHSNTRVKLDPLIDRAKTIIRNIKSFIHGKDPPPLHINKHCQFCLFGNDCIKTALQNDDLSLIRNLTPKDIRKLQGRGIFTVNQLSYTFRPRRKRKSSKIKLNPFNPALKALALMENRVHVFEIPDLDKNDIEIYLDIENLPDFNFYYLIGMLVNAQGTFYEYSFWADKIEQQKEIFRSFFEILSDYDDYTIYHYGQFEKKCLKRLARSPDIYNAEKANKALKRCCNILPIVYSNIYFPTYSNGLKEIAKYLGFSWSSSEACGIQSILWRMEWEKNKSYKIKNKLLTYNLNDCYALKMIKDFIDTIIESNKDVSLKRDDIVFQNQVKRTSSFKFLSGEYAAPEIETIHKYSLFDYQREKVFVRTDDSTRISEKRRNKKKSSNLRPNKNIINSAKICVNCKSRNIRAIKPISKKIIDLKLTQSGIKRWITKFSSYTYHCKECDTYFSPEKYKIGLDKIIPKGCRKNRSRYGHNLKSWTMYQYIVNRLSFRKIESDLYEFFHLVVSKSSLHGFMQYIHKYYRTAYRTFLKTVVNSDVLYINETPLKMRNEDGYAWVFTNNREIVSIYKPNREGDFLKSYYQIFMESWFQIFIPPMIHLNVRNKNV